MKTLISTLSLLVFVFAATPAAWAQNSTINAPLTSDHWNMIFDRAPFLVQPGCDPTSQIPCRIDKDDDNPTNNTKMGKKFSLATTAAEIDVDFVSAGQVDMLVYQFNRPDPGHYGYDGEAVLVFLKRDHVGNIFKDKPSAYKYDVVSVRTNAHGGAPELAGSAKYANVIGPNYAATFKGYVRDDISPKAQVQLSSNGRVAAFVTEKSDGSISHPVVLSDRSNALIPASDLQQLGKDFDDEGTVIFYPVLDKDVSGGEARAADTAELKKHFPNATFKPYSLNREFSKNAIRLHGKNFFCKAYPTAAVQFASFDAGTVVTVAGIGSDARINDAGEESGANFWHGWTNIGLVDAGGTRKAETLAPKHYKKGLERIPVIYTQDIIERTFVGLLSDDEKKAGGSRVVRNGFMVDVPAGK